MRLHMRRDDDLHCGQVIAQEYPVSGPQNPLNVPQYIACIGTTHDACSIPAGSSTLVSSLGPAMALRGKDGTSMRIAVEHMKSNRKAIRNSFGIGVACFMLIVGQVISGVRGGGW